MKIKSFDARTANLLESEVTRWLAEQGNITIHFVTQSSHTSLRPSSSSPDVAIVLTVFYTD